MTAKPPPDDDYLSFDDFEELLADKPRGERWELIGRCLVGMTVGARWEHALIVQTIATLLENVFAASGASCQTFTETFYMKKAELDAALLPDVMVVLDRPSGCPIRGNVGRHRGGITSSYPVTARMSKTATTSTEPGQAFARSTVWMRRSTSKGSRRACPCGRSIGSSSDREGRGCSAASTSSAS